MVAHFLSCGIRFLVLPWHLARPLHPGRSNVFLELELNTLNRVSSTFRARPDASLGDACPSQ